MANGKSEAGEFGRRKRSIQHKLPNFAITF
jgi:hypothetical protein